MKIKEVEIMLDISKATIRFYEKEGLLTPQRNDNSYRDYSQEDIERLKKIVILRKIGISVEDIRNILNDTLSLQDALTHTIEDLNNQIKEIEGAIKVCTIMQDRKEDMCSFDEDYYWNTILSEEKNGNKFFELVNDVLDFEKKVIADEFGLRDEQGNMRFSFKTSIVVYFFMCVAAGLLWFFLDHMNIHSFVEGFFFPFVCIIISSIVGLPLYFLEKKNKKLADTIKKIGYGVCIVIFIVVVLLMLFVEV